MTDKDCKTCKGYEGCAGKIWYSYGDIRFCPYQIVWVLSNLENMMIGRWPENPDKPSSGYDIEYYPEQKGHRWQNASYTKVCEIAGEVEWRINKCGPDGDIVRTRYSELYRDDSDCYHLAGKLGMPVNELELIINRVLRYVSGWRKKYNKDGTIQTYKEFKGVEE